MMAATGTRAQEFRDQLSRRVLVADGAMGTMLYARGVFLNRSFDELNSPAPDLVRGIHQELHQGGLGDPGNQHVSALTAVAAGRIRHGREVEGYQPAPVCGWRAKRRATTAFVAGAVGPLGVRIEPLGPTSFAEARAASASRWMRLAEAGVDVLIFETSATWMSCAKAVLAARDSIGDAVPIVAQVTIDDFRPSARRRRYGNLHPRDGFVAGGVIGLNCSVGPRPLVGNHRADAGAFPPADDAHAQRRLGRCAGGRNMYLSRPRYMAQYARRMLWAGVKIVGGCCGHHAGYIS